MKHRKIGLLVFLVVLMVPFHLFMGPVVLGEADYEQIAISYISRAEGTSSADLMVGYGGFRELRALGIKFWEGKVLNKNTGETFGVALNLDGSLANRETLMKSERSAWNAKYGKLTPGLYEYLQKAEAVDSVDVVIWVYAGAGPSLREGASYEEVQAWNKRVKTPLTSHLEGRGIKVKYSSTYSPLLFATMSKEAVFELSAREDVGLIDIEGVGGPELNVAHVTVGADTVHARGITGYGPRVAHVEGHPGAIYFAHAAVPDGKHYRTPPSYADHATMCAGCIASTDATYKGIAKGLDGSASNARLLSANAASYGDSDLLAAIDWAVGQGAHIITNSYYTHTDQAFHAIDMAFDHYVYWHGIVMIKSAGNRGDSDGYVTSPGKGYNTLTVGAFDDKGSAAWTGDTMASFSSYVDPIAPNSDQPEKPEIVAPGVSITAPSYPSTWDTGSGTSFAAPQAAGAAALLMHRNSRLYGWPEPVKAILMATAIHNIEGATRLSEYDGAGAIYCPYADDIARLQWIASWVYRTMISTSITYEIQLTAGQRARIVMVWDSQPTHAHPATDDPRMADLDLYVYNPAGTLVASSTSVSNCFEIVDFTVPSSGKYRVKLHRFSFTAGWPGDYIALAYWQGPTGAPLATEASTSSAPSPSFVAPTAIVTTYQQASWIYVPELE